MAPLTSPKSIKIRKMRIRDLPQVIAIQETITRTPIGPQKKSFLREHIQKENSLDLVALEKNRVLGYIISEVLTNSFGLDQGGWIENFGIHPRYMGQGIGRTLAAHLFAAYKQKGISEIYTSVRWDSVDLLSFFKSIGFDRSDFINLYKKVE
jgi:ribosomal protein S18 acetylase RimI-like enzyme